MYQKYMHILKIQNENENIILRQPSRLVTTRDFKDFSVKKAIEQLKNSLIFYGNGVGLSAIQVGISLQVFVINCRPTESFPTMQTFEKIVINPLITHYSTETFSGWEWCMSIANEHCIPEQRYQITRSTAITFDYTDESNIRHTDQQLSGISAVVFQHEYDHLFGKLIDQVGISWKIISNKEYKRRIAEGEKMVLS